MNETIIDYDKLESNLEFISHFLSSSLENKLIADTRQTLGPFSGIADFFHLNPSCPNREITGVLRTQKITHLLSQIGQNPILHLIYDTTTPDSEAAREGGGVGIFFGAPRKTIRCVNDPKALLVNQPAFQISVSETLKKAESYIQKLCPGNNIALETVLGTISSILADFNSVKSCACRSEQVLIFKQKILGRFQVEIANIARLTKLLPQLAQILQLTYKAKIRWFELPTSNKTGYLFRRILNGKIVGIVKANSKQKPEYQSFDGDHHFYRDWDEVLDDLFCMRLIPGIDIYILGFVVLPAWLHFGNLYDKHKLIVDWVVNRNEKHPGFIRVGNDGENSIPFLFTRVPTQYGSRIRSLTTVDLLIHTPQKIASLARQVANLGMADSKTVDFRSHICNYSLPANDL